MGRYISVELMPAKVFSGTVGGSWRASSPLGGTGPVRRGWRTKEIVLTALLP
jgi:hypothetical protein